VQDAQHAPAAGEVATVAEDDARQDKFYGTAASRSNLS
jgi:hypothetical protein